MGSSGKWHLLALSVSFKLSPLKPLDSVIWVPQRLKWKSTPSSCLIINFDGVILNEENLVGIGVVIWDEKGQVIASMAKNVGLPSFVVAWSFGNS